MTAKNPRVVLGEYVVAAEPQGRFTINFPTKLGPDYAASRGYRPLYLVRTILKTDRFLRIDA